MLRKILLSTALVAAAGSAVAADLPYRTSAPAPAYVAAPIFTWTGFYVGLNAGAAFNNKNTGSISSFGLVAPNNAIYTGGSSSDTAFTGGVTAGYNMQFGSFVAGVEGDINYLDRKSGGNGLFPAPRDVTAGFDDRTDFAVSRGNGSNYFGTLRGRLGFAFDRALIYGTGGLAFGGKSGSFGVSQRDYTENCTTPLAGGACAANGTFTTNATRGLASGGNNNNNVGYALGGGLEYAFSNAWSLKAEYLHVSLGDNSRTFTTLTSAAGPAPAPAAGSTMAAGHTITIRDSNKFDVIRAGVNYRF
jgi:outer membrane immunogenic protein